MGEVDKIKITQVARDEIERLDTTTRKMVIGKIQHDLVERAHTSPLMKIDSLDTQVRIFRVSPDMRVLFTEEDVDKDGQKEIVVLKVVDRFDLEHFKREGAGRIGPLEAVEDLPRSARIGQEVLYKINQAES